MKQKTAREVLALAIGWLLLAIVCVGALVLCALAALASGAR